MREALNFRLVVMAHPPVGNEILDFLLAEHPDHVAFVVIEDKGAEPVEEVLARHGFPAARTLRASQMADADVLFELEKAKLDMVLLAWWPRIVKQSVFDLARRGVVNLHPSLLPHCRGKGPNFWSIVEERPFGVTLHFATTDIDAGDVLFQREIPVGWEDTGGTLHTRARAEMVSLFRDSYDKLSRGDYTPRPLDLETGSLHYMRELDPASIIDLDASYRARDLLNLLRARTFAPHPACRFTDGGETYEVRVEITRVDPQPAKAVPAADAAPKTPVLAGEHSS